MEFDRNGFLRPSIGPVSTAGTDGPEARLFKKTCPGWKLRVPHNAPSVAHPIFGDYLGAWTAWAIDPEVRHSGSSGGVLTALSIWLVESGQTRAVIGSSSNKSLPTETTPVRIVSKAEALGAAGSRYAPVCNLPELRLDAAANALVGKPCEASAAYQLFEARELPDEARPLLMTFFCAGTPSQHATESLVAQMGIQIRDVVGLRYRGNGWPGRFALKTRSGSRHSVSYEDSWGSHLGRHLQTRCKLCVDGVGRHGDLSVGDFWNADADGYPSFTDADGVSVLIARTRRGLDLINSASEHGLIHLSDINLDDVLAMQPLQVDRIRTLAGRLIGRLLAGKSIPRYSGYRLLALAAGNPLRTLRAAIGSFARSLGVKRGDYADLGA